MKKALVLSAAAAMVAMAWAPVADAGDVKIGGYYMGRWQAFDVTPFKDAGNQDDGEWYAQRLQLNMDMSASEKSHAHMRLRVLNADGVSGADLGNLSPGLASNTVSSNTTSSGNAGTGKFDIRQIWMETDAWGVGVKFGDMPIELNDSILVGQDETAFGTLMLSKTFGDVTAVLANVRVNEGNISGAAANNAAATAANAAATAANTAATAAVAAAAAGTGTAAAAAAANAAAVTAATAATAAAGTVRGASNDDSNLFAMSLFGKAGMVDYNATLAYLNVNEDSDFAVRGLSPAAGLGTNQDSDNIWAALTLSGQAEGVDIVGTIIYENGYDIRNNAGGKLSNQFSDDGWLGALRLKGKTGFGGWNGYAFISSSGFNSITNSNMVWSPTWDMSGPGGRDLMNLAVSSISNGGATWSSPSENMMGIGVGLTLDAGGWTVRPSLDYASVTDDTVTNNGVTTRSSYDNVWGGSLLLSTKIQEATTLSVEGGYVDPSSNTATPSEGMYFAQTGIKMQF